MQRILDTFHHHFKRAPNLFAAPGRINLIGEHTDYNDGFVLPATIDKTLYFALAANELDQFRFVAVDVNETATIPRNLVTRQPKQWINYLLGVIDQLQKQGIDVPGFDLAFGGDIPIGAGVSSSAALECGLLYGLNQMFGWQLKPLFMATLAQKAEHQFIGLQCGIMDQFAVLFGKQDCAIKLDCRSLEYQYVPLVLSDYAIILCNTGVSHNLAASEYNRRRRECGQGVELLQKRYPIHSLRDVTLAQLQSMANTMNNVLYRRCDYVIKENTRVTEACQALAHNNIAQFGQLLFESHQGLRDDYQVSCEELDELVKIASEIDGVAGARMMGGGFGGCTINLVHNDATADFINAVDQRYYHKYHKSSQIMTTRVSTGAHRVVPL